MHIQPITRTFDVVLSSKEIRHIIYGLQLHAQNPGTKAEVREDCIKMAEKFANALKHPQGS